MKNTKKNKDPHIVLRLNRYNTSLLICSVAFLTRYMYYGRVENVDMNFFYDTENFNDDYYQLRLLMNLLNEKSKITFGEYIEYKISK